jgi:hypothetical protein
MAGFTSYDDIIASLSAGKSYYKEFGKSLWRVGNLPAAGADTGGALVSAAGGLVMPDQAVAYKHLLTFGGVASTNGTLMIYDRLVQVPTISVASTGNRTVNTAALPRYADGVGVQCWLEVTTATTVTAPVVHLHSYTDEGANPSQDSVTNFTFPAAATVLNSLIGPLPILAEDVGIQAVATLNVSTAGNQGAVTVVLLRPLAFLPMIQNTWNERDMVLQLASLPRIYDGATLAMAFLPNAVTATNLWGQTRIGYN